VVSTLGGLKPDFGPEDEVAQASYRSHPLVDRLWLEAMRRYVNLAANGVAMHHALAAVRKIDPDFYVEEQEHAWLLAALKARAQVQTGHADVNDPPRPKQKGFQGLPGAKALGTDSDSLDDTLGPKGAPVLVKMR